jgi:hypothetical protein
LPGQPPDEKPDPGERAGVSASAALDVTAAAALPDVSDQSAATTAALESTRATSGPSVAQLQQLARLATLAYRSVPG